MPLTLHRAPRPQREATAWFLPDPDPAAWLAEVARWPVATEAVVFLPLAVHARSAEAAGALLVPPAGTRVPAGGRAQPFSSVARGIYLPIDAELMPAVAAEELRAATRFAVLVFHPSLGLTGAEENEARHAWQLLGPPATTAEDWSVARAGAARAPGLRAVHLRAELSLDDIFGEESKDIASESPADLPPTPEERRNTPGSRIVQRAGEGLAKVMLGLAALVPRTTGIAPTWVNALENWAAQKLSGFNADLERERHKELHRLLDLLKRDLEEGLRRAIPLAALAHRGRATPSAQLGRRTLDFDLRRLRGGGAGDFWVVPDDVQSALAQQYREAAMREQKLGRHRRAACIFAELLGDFAAAADVLKQGRHFREAAHLYLERLNDPLAAAECLAAAGLFAEAIAIYEKHARWLDLADIHAKLGDTAAEHSAVRRAVSGAVAAGDVIGASRLLNRRLDAPDEALDLLSAAWPRGAQALACLTERFDLLQQRQRLDETRALIAQLGREETSASQLVGLTDLLAKTVEGSTDVRLRHAAANAVRGKVARGLADGALQGKGEVALLRALTRIAPGDRLLARDVMRFRTKKPKPAPPRAVAPPAPAPLVRRVTPTQSGQLQLPPAGKWARASGGAPGIHAVARLLTSEIMFCRTNWAGATQQITWPDPAADRGGLFFLSPHIASAIVGRPFAGRLPLRRLPAMDAFGSEPGEVGTPPWLPEDTVQIAVSRFSVWAARVVGDRVVLDSFEREMRAASRDVTDQLVAAGATGGGTSLLLEAQLGLGRVALGYGSHVLVQAGREPKIQDLGSRVVGLMIGPPTALGWIALLERGAAFVSLDGSTHYMIDDQLVRPRAAHLGDGRVVLVGEEEGVVVRLEMSGAKRDAWFPFSSGNGIGLSATPHPREFAVFHENGFVQRWQLPV